MNCFGLSRKDRVHLEQYMVFFISLGFASSIVFVHLTYILYHYYTYLYLPNGLDVAVISGFCANHTGLRNEGTLHTQEARVVAVCLARSMAVHFDKTSSPDPSALRV
jgi:hypothetical protein